MNPKFSVIVPVYNRALSVLPTLRSIQEQTFADFDCIVVDDGSDDGDELRRVVEGLKDRRFRYLRRENGGPSAARNTGVDDARGEYVAFLDSDDLWLPGKLAIQGKQLDQFPDRIAYSQCWVDRGVGKRWLRPRNGISADADLGEYLFVQNEFIPTQTLALSTEAARAVRWDPSLARGEDFDFVLRLRAAGHQFAYWPQPLAIWQDVTEVGRASYSPGTGPTLAFLSKHGASLTPKARRGFRATYLAYDLASEKPAEAIRAMVAGAAAGVPLRVVLRQFLRAFLPRRVYRSLVNAFVATAGK